VVDDDELETKENAWPGIRKVGGRPVRQVLDLTDRLPPDEADEPAGQWRRSGHVLGAPALESASSAARGARPAAPPNARSADSP
jgi:hypothetical protein